MHVVNLVPKVLHPALFSLARTCRVRIFNVPDPFTDMLRLRRTFAPDAVLDVGAHEGQTARELQKVFPGVPIHSFEPTNDTFTKLKSNVGHLPDVHLHQLALGNCDGEAQFFLNSNSQTNSLLDNDEDNLKAVGEGAQHVNVANVRIRQLDTWFAQSGLQPDARLLLKADVQGSESMLIAGGMKTFRENVVAFYTEASIAQLYKGQASLTDLLQVMEECGFKVYQLYRTRSDAYGRALWCDAMWINPRLVNLRS